MLLARTSDINMGAPTYLMVSNSLFLQEANHGPKVSALLLTKPNPDISGIALLV